jgi:hypothetical protein
MTCKEIIKQWLRDNGYDGLVKLDQFNLPCGCNLDDFMPCPDESDCRDCQPAYRQDCKRINGAYCMVKEKGADPNCEDCEV